MIFLTGIWVKMMKMLLEPIYLLASAKFDSLSINLHKNLIKIQKVNEKHEEKKVEISTNEMKNLDNDHDKNVIFSNEDERSEAGSSEDEKDDDDENEDIIDDGKYKLEEKIETEELVKELRERLYSISSPEDLLKGTQEIDEQKGNYQAEIMDENGKIIDQSKKIM